MKKELNLCRKIALGSLIQGYFHNLRGTVQAISLELQMLLLKKDPNSSPEVYQRINKAFSLLEKLQSQLETAFEEIFREKKGSWNLKKFLEKEILFWEANLDFKHKVKKEIIAEKDLNVEGSYNFLKGIFCLIFQELVYGLKEETYLKIFIKDKVEFVWDKEIEKKALERLKILAESLKDQVEIKVDKNKLQICLKNFCG